MRFTVVWAPVAQTQLATRWLTAPDRNAVTQAQHQIDQLLAVDPDQKGVDHYGDWMLVVPPLQVIYSINRDDMQVVIEMVF
jgi:hypothetical protein